MRNRKKSERALGFLDIIALSFAVFRMFLPLLLIMLLSIWAAGIIIVNILG